MESEAASVLALRLLELEQRFESYCALHDEELKEIQSTLNQLRADILSVKRSRPSLDPIDRDRAVPDGDGVAADYPENLPILAL
jgi:hypothetical protein